MSEAAAGGCMCCTVVTVIITILVLISYEGIEPTEYAILRSKWDQSIDTETILTSGRKWTGLMATTIKYPAIEQSIEFSDSSTATQSKLKTRTKEGLDLVIHFSLQYKLLPAKLPELYRLLEEDYQRVFERLARNSVLEVASDWTAQSYWLNRTEIGDQMMENLQLNYKKVHANVTGFMLLKINLPDSYEKEIVNTQVMRQEKFTYDKLLDVRQSEQEVENIKAAGLRAVTVIQSAASANATKVINEGEGSVVKQNIQWTTKALQKCQEQLAFLDPKSALLEYYKYQRLNQLSKYTENRLVYGGIDVTYTQ